MGLLGTYRCPRWFFATMVPALLSRCDLCREVDCFLWSSALASSSVPVGKWEDLTWNPKTWSHHVPIHPRTEGRSRRCSRGDIVRGITTTS